MTKFVIALLSLVAAGAIFFLYTQPTYARIQALQADIEEFDRALDKARELQDLKRSLLARYNTFTSDQLGRLNKLLPDHVDNVRLVLDLDNMASRYGMAVQNVLISDSPGSTEDTQVIGSLGEQAVLYESLTMQFSTRGTYSGFVRFMEDLETSLRIVDVTSLSVTQDAFANSEEEAFGEPLYRFNVALRTYWLK